MFTRCKTTLSEDDAFQLQETILDCSHDIDSIKMTVYDDNLKDQLQRCNTFFNEVTTERQLHFGLSIYTLLM